MLPIADKVDPKLINFWVNADDKEILQGKKLGAWVVPLQDLKDQGVIKVAGYPVRPSFVRETNPKTIDHIKTSKGIPAKSQVVLLSMGRQGIGDHIIKYVKMLHESRNKISKHMQVVIICGKNNELKQDIERYLKELAKRQKNRNVHFRVEGYMDEKDMADYFKVANVLISKPGGATAAEAATMGVPMLSVDPHDWELPNQVYLERHGLAERLISKKTFISQIQRLMASKRKALAFEPIDWKRQMATLVE